MALASAHKGYEYQDLLVAIRLVDVLLNSVVTVHVDEKLVPKDKFDDLTTVDGSGVRERIQIKYAANVDQTLTLATFTTDARNLRLDRLVSSVLADRSGPGIDAKQLSYRIILTDLRPTDPYLCSVLTPANPDPGPFVHGLDTVRLRFGFDALLRGTNSHGAPPLDDSGPFDFLMDGDATVSRADLKWICHHLIVEVAAPVASLDLTKPNKAERLLLQRVRAEVGAEVYPNAGRSAVDVAAALIGSARAARQQSLTVTASELLRRAQLRSDFGAVSRANPVDQSMEVRRSTIVTELAQEASVVAENGTAVLLVGPPGQGKSWLCQQLINELTDDQWLVAEHYCYLGDADGERLSRALAESVFGSLLRRLADYDPALLSSQRPKFAAHEQALTDAVAAARSKWGNRRVALVVDGIDHVTRVIGGSLTDDPSLSLAEALAALRLPHGSTLIVLSQPGTHLEPLKSAGAVTVPVPKLTHDELQELACRLGVLSYVSADSDHSHSLPLIEDEHEAGQFLSALSERSAGNALYATYLCREALTRAATIVGPAATVRSLPDFDGTLHAYYKHIQSSLGLQGAWVADVVALVDFPVSVRELKEIRPDMAYRVDEAVAILRPVLLERATHAGIRVYHESFARFLRIPFQDNATSRIGLLKRIIKWLGARGLLKDSRAFRHLLPMLSEANCNQEVVDAVGGDFVINSIAAGFAASEIIKNLATAIRSAAVINDWGAIARYVELSRSLETFETEERFEATVVGFEDVIASLVGTQTLAERLLHDGRPTLTTRSGLRICSVLDGMGAVAPWREYMLAYLRENGEDTRDSDRLPDSTFDAAWLRGRLRLANFGHTQTLDTTQDHESPSPRTESERALYAPVRWDSLVERLNRGDLSSSKVVHAILDTFGLATAVALIPKLAHAGVFCLALAEAISERRDSRSEGDPRQWATRAVEYGLPFGTRWRLFALGLDVDNVDQQPIKKARARLLQLTREVQDPFKYREDQTVLEWMDACSVAAKRDTFGLAAAEALLGGSGWYRCWLRFVIALALCEASVPDDQSQSGLAAIRILTEVRSAFIGDPRACDLLPLHGLIDATIWRAVSLLNDDDWGKAIEILDTVSGDISTTMDGEIGGPVGRHSLLRLAIKTATPTRWTKAQELVNEEIENGGFGGYYADLAQHRLMAARLALAADNETEARIHWANAWQLLLGYGSHKDSTIYELVDPLSDLIGIDPKRGRVSVAELQPLCERVPFHTDGRGTKHAWSRWWKLLARADPCALSRLIEPKLLGSCNDPDSLLQGARSDLWRAWHHRADPIVAGALRLTLDEALDPNDISALRRLTRMCDAEKRKGLLRLLDALLSRVDERPFKYGHSDDREWLDRDRRRVDELNGIATIAGAPQIAPLPRVEVREDSPFASGKHRRKKSFSTPLPDEPIRCFADGAVGVRQAIRAWRERRYDESRPSWSVQRFQNALGYRLLELLEEGRREDVEAALDLIGGASGFDRSPVLLTALAEGFERHGHRESAAMAFAVAWTRARGSGGWKMFGGETHIESLRRAVELNRPIALRTVSREVERVVSRGTGTLGVTQSLIYGFANGGLTTSVSLAFDIWDEAFKVIASRAPRLGSADDPDDVYAAPVPDLGDDPPGDIDSAHAAAVLAGLFHPGREHKRRALVAIQILIDQRPSTIAPAIKSALLSMSDVATLTWLLRVIERAGDSAASVVSVCRDALIELAGRPQLVVRTLARRLLSEVELPLPSATEPDAELLDRGSDLVVPADSNNRDGHKIDLEAVIDEIAGFRLSHGEQILPGLRGAVVRRVAAVRKSDGFKRRSRAQFRAYGDESSQRMPDAFLTLDEEVEDAIQHTAAGARAARLMNGDLSTDPLQLEDSLAQALLDDPQPALAIEFSRQPRPEIPPPPFRGDRIWQLLRLHAEDGTADETGVEAASQDDGVIFGTLSISGPDKVPTIVSGPYNGWRLIAAHERREVPHPEWDNKEEQIANRYQFIELRVHGDKQALTLPPITMGDSDVWNAIRVPADFLNRSFRSQPVVGSVRPRRHALGIPVTLLTPTRWLLAALRIEKGTHFVLDDEKGRALALITWRTEYETSDYFLAWPRLCGSGLAVRPDAFNKLVRAAKEQLTFRDFLRGASSLSR